MQISNPQSVIPKPLPLPLHHKITALSKEVKPYNDDNLTKKQEITQMFDNIAPRYDLLNRVLSVGIDNIWRKNAINELQDIAPQTILDVATGTCDLALEAMRLNPKKIIGVDISSQMLVLGQQKIDKKGFQDIIKLKLGDSENLPFESNTFDAATVGFGVRNFENLEQGLSELHRVIRPGGKLVVLEFSKPSKFPVKQVYFSYFKYVLPNIGKLVSKDQSAYTYLPASVQAFPEGKQFIEKLKECGFKTAKCKEQTFGICSIYTAEKV